MSASQAGRPGRGIACRIEGCPREAWARELCNAHYQRLRQYGDPLAHRGPLRHELAGRRIGALTVLERAPGGSWRCQCDCGAVIVVRSSNLVHRRIGSCGDLRKHIVTPTSYHGVHDRLAYVLGPASKRSCVDCGRRAAHWSYDRREDEPELSPEGPWSRSLEQYRPRCVSCHKRFDLRARRLELEAAAGQVPLF